MVLHHELENKRRSTEDLIRFIQTRAGNTPNYGLLMGAGCSVTSGIRPASTLIEEWRKELFARFHKGGEAYEAGRAIKFLTETQNRWYNAQREYSSLFEKKFDLQKQRRIFVEKEVADKVPSIGYAYLVRLIENNYLNCVFTTNFDDLLNEAFNRFSDLRPIVCAHDSAISSITTTSARPKIIKLHGDYLFDDLKSTASETESLQDNMKQKFLEFSREFGLIVMGYSGSDRSVMDILRQLLRNDDYFKGGVYWCDRKGKVISEDVSQILWRERVLYVEIDGFDEFFAQAHHAMLGDSLPISTALITAKPRDIIDQYCKNDYLVQSSSAHIKEDLRRLKSEVTQERFVDAIRKISTTATRESSSLDKMSLLDY